MNKESLPNGWGWTTLQEVCLPPQYGWTTRASPHGTLRLLRTTDITTDSLNWPTVPFCSEEPPEKKKYLLKTGDIVISRAGSVGCSYLIKNPPKAVFASYLIRFRPLPMIDEDYLSFFLKSSFYWNTILAEKTGSTLPNVNATKLKRIPVPLPPLPEQRAIAHVLQTIQEAKSARQRELALERERKAALMDHLFSYGTKGEPRKQTEIGEIPESWKLGTIGEICERIIDYRGRTPKFSESGIVHLRSSNVKEGRLILKDDEITYVTDETYKSFMTRGLPKAGDIIFTTEGPLGESAMVPPDFRFSLAQRMVLLRADKTVLDSSYLLYVLYSEQVRRGYLGRATGSTAKGISSKNFQQVQVPLPCLSEQQEIAISLTACDTKIAALEGEAARLDELFHAMLDELMTGKRAAVSLIDAEQTN